MSLINSSTGLLSSLIERAQDAIFALSSCLPCMPETSTLKLNGRTFQIIKLLGEGGFSFVYLVKDTNSGRLFALKKIRCSSYGTDSFREAIKEIEATKRFRSPHIIPIYDSCVIQDDAGSGTLFGNLPSDDSSGGHASDSAKVIYLFLPYYERGNLQDAIHAHLLRGSRFSENEILHYFLGTCKAVKEMHQYRLPNVGVTRSSSSFSTNHDRSSIPKMEITPPSAATADGYDQDPFTDTPAANVPLMSDDNNGQDRPADDNSYPPKPSNTNNKGKSRDLGLDSHPSVTRSETETSAGIGQLVPYSHRDIKPANVMISDDDLAVLMDFGSTIRARVTISSRKEALAHQDMAAERSSMPYRAPELFDVPTDTTLTESVDIWSLGCLLYSLAYLHSPFENTQTVEQGGSIALAVLNGSYKFPQQHDPYSENTKSIIRACLEIDPSLRPNIDHLIHLTNLAIRGVE